MIWKIVIAIVAILVIAIIGIYAFTAYLNLKAKRNRKAFLASHPQTPLTEEKKRLLTFGAILSLYRYEDILSLVTDSSMSEYAEGLRDQWDITGREEALETLDTLLSFERSHELDGVLHQHMGSDDLKQLQNTIAQELGMSLAQVQATTSTYAWDVCRLVSLAKWCYWLHYISEEEMWKYHQDGAVKAAAAGKDWNDYTVSFLLGRALQGFQLDDILPNCKTLFQNDPSEQDSDVYSRYSFK